MKKLFSTILVLGLMLNGNAYANKISIQCVGDNTPNVTFTITKDNIILSDGFVFDLDGVTSTTATGYKNDYRRNFFGIKKIYSRWTVLINLSDRTATITRYFDFKGNLAQDSHRHYYSSCR